LEFEVKLDLLHIYKSSPSTYEKLRKMLILPCRTLIYILNKVPFGPGINEQIFNHLKKLGETMSENDKLLSMSFDETVTHEQLLVNRRLGNISGYEDFGTCGRTHRPVKKILG
jgi:hypothetical protein